MDIFLRNISWNINEGGLMDTFAAILHGEDEPFQALSPGVLINFRVTLFPDRRYKGARPHSGTGLLTLPSSEIGRVFLERFGDGAPVRCPLILDGRKLSIQISGKPLRQDLITAVSQMPYISREQMLAREQEKKELEGEVKISAIQFGRECRDGAFSVEWKRVFNSRGRIIFEPDKREIQVHLPEDDTRGLSSQIVSFRFSGIQTININRDRRMPSVYFILNTPASFYECKEVPEGTEFYSIPNLLGIDLIPISHLDGAHLHVAPFTSTALRVILTSQGALGEFRRMAKRIHHRISDYTPEIVERCLYSKSRLSEVDHWLSRLPHDVGFQCDALMRSPSCLVDAEEMLSLKQPIIVLVKRHGEKKTASFLKHFANTLNQLWFSEVENVTTHTVLGVFKAVEQEFDFNAQPLSSSTEGLTDCFHVSVTPTAIHLSGPFPEQSNRVIRMYPGKEHHFVRICFMDENNLQYRFARDVNGPEFVRTRVGGILKDGIRIAGRYFQWLAYSMSGLKEHAVWFMEPFTFDGRFVDAAIILSSLGDFTVKKVNQRPALYGARISQAFSATDPGVVIEAEEAIPIRDIKRNGSIFTDGVGTMSPELAKQVWQKQVSLRKRQRHKKNIPAVVQIRLGGAKGMLSVDTRLQGRMVCLRDSMTKFDSPALEIEVAGTFTRPRRMFLNRPMIMLLEGLGVDSHVFLQLQRDAVEHTVEATKDIGSAAQLIESFGLGSAYRLPSVLQGLRKLGLSFGPDAGASTIQSQFLTSVLDCTVHHALRELKYQARIPVPGSWTLVGVADIHKELREGEIFACILDINDSEAKFLEGPCLITRSPVIHPGDLQMVYAIGRPPQGSRYVEQPLANSVVFSVRGTRSLSSCLGGGDLDGDEFNLIMLKDLQPPRDRICAPANYAPAERKSLGRPCRAEDLVDFIVEYINSDIIGLVASTWLILADYTQNFVEDSTCLMLADLHSRAVDYPKSGIPVPQTGLPRTKMKPDWSAPETVREDDTNFYISQRAIGQLFRDINLPAMNAVKPRKVKVEDEEDIELDTYDLDSTLNSLSLSATYPEDPISKALYIKLSEWLDEDEEDITDMDWVRNIFSTYSQELSFICRNHTLSFKRGSRLSEEEVLIGSILAKTSQRRRRKDLMSQMRDRATVLVSQIKEELTGKDIPSFTRIRRAWAAWRFSRFLVERDHFGAESFGIIAIGSFLDAVATLEAMQR